MPCPKTPWRAAADELLSDGEWHDQEAVVAVMARMVPPSRAIRVRRYFRDRWSSASEKAVSLDHEVRVGTNAIVKKAMRKAARDGAWERDDDMIRLRPS